jgi:hypothetical protein
VNVSARVESSAPELQFLNFSFAADTNRRTQAFDPLGDIMSNAAHTTENAINDIPVELVELQKVIEALPTEHKLAIQPAFQRVVESTNRRRKILQLVQESIGQLRLDMKYLVFDLEATRRERDRFQDQLRELNGEEGDFNGDSSPETE